MGLARTSPLEFSLDAVPPFRLDLAVWTLRRRPENIVDRWYGQTYRRVLVGEDGSPYEVAVSQSGSPDIPHLQVLIEGKSEDLLVEQEVASSLECLLGIRVDLKDFYGLARRDGVLMPLAERFRGFKPPRFQSSFEALVNAIACQQLTLTVGIRLLNRLAETYGLALRTSEGVFHAFPRPSDLAEADPENMRALGFSYQKSLYIIGLARSIVGGQFSLDGIEVLDDEHALERLRSLKGVGRWTAEYVLLRGLRRTHIFPADDVGARNNLGRWLGLPGPLNSEAVQAALSPWRGYGGLIYFHLLLKSLGEKELIATEGRHHAPN